jgi:hypothetical protein
MSREYGVQEDEADKTRHKLQTHSHSVRVLFTTGLSHGCDGIIGAFLRDEITKPHRFDT